MTSRGVLHAELRVAAALIAWASALSQNHHNPPREQGTSVYEKISGLTFGTLSADDREKSRSSWNWLDVIASTAVLDAILAAYLYFNG